VLKASLGPGVGVVAKIEGQTSTWRHTGHAVKVFGLVPARPEQHPFSAQAQLIRADHRVARSLASRSLVAAVLNWQPDIVYLRQCSYQPGFSTLFDCAPVVIEVNTDDVRELPQVSKLSHYYNLATRGRLLRRASGFAFVTSELAGSLSFGRRDVPRVVIGNGIWLSEAVPRQHPPSNDRPHLFFIGSPGFAWHGVDKIVALARHRPSWHFDLVGPSAREIENPGNVIAHGPMSQREYGPMLAQADVALSTLALHRKGLDEACPLKTREYLAAGVPVITAYLDTDFPNGAPFLLRLPNIEDNIVPNLSAIDEFVARSRGTVVERRDVLHLDWAHKEPRRLALMEQVVDTHCRAQAGGAE